MADLELVLMWVAKNPTKGSFSLTVFKMQCYLVAMVTKHRRSQWMQSVSEFFFHTCHGRYVWARRGTTIYCSAVNWVIILSALTVSIFEKTYQGKKNRQGKRDEMSSSANPGGRGEWDSHKVTEKGTLTAGVIQTLCAWIWVSGIF